MFLRGGAAAKRVFLQGFSIEQGSVWHTSSTCGPSLGGGPAHSPGPGTSSSASGPCSTSCEGSGSGSKRVRWTPLTPSRVSHVCVHGRWPFCHVPAGTWRKAELGKILFERAVDDVLAEGQVEKQLPSRSKALLQASSCFGNHQASLLLATILLSGLRHEVDREQVHPAPLFRRLYSPSNVRLSVSGPCLQFDGGSG